MSFVKKIKRKITNKIKNILLRFDRGRNYFHAKSLYLFYNNKYKCTWKEFKIKYKNKIKVIKKYDNKEEQIKKLIEVVDIVPVENNMFFYSIDCFKTVELKHHILDNYSVDYSFIVNNSFKELEIKYNERNTEYDKSQLILLSAFKNYYLSLKNNSELYSRFKKQIDAIGSLFDRPAENFFEGLQRILFFNQFLWQTRHKHNGFGRLDLILGELYQKDLASGKMNKEDAKAIISDFYKVLHENCWYKSTMLLGDTGQIVILGGKKQNGEYFYNELTYEFINVAMDLKLPDPKVLLRCSCEMPDDLLNLALKCISTGIGAPFLSNDDAVIPSLIQFGYNEADAYEYITSACWEPLIKNVSCDQNNIASFNFATPFVNMLDSEGFNEIDSFSEILYRYSVFLDKYLKGFLDYLSQLEFEDDPLISLLSDSANEYCKDIVHGGAKYSNLGLTSVGLASVVNSFLNIKKLVFDKKTFLLKDLNIARKRNYVGCDDLVNELKNIYPCYGSDDEFVVELTKKIQGVTSEILKRYKTLNGGCFKYGLSSPNYIIDANKTTATLDGRKDFEPFAVHISSNSPLPATELIRFASLLDYSDNRINGNVVDFFVAPSTLLNNIDKFQNMLKTSFKEGLYQLQMNVVDSKKLIEAKKNPELFPQLVVRVWGFSSYFNDLPEEYKDLLIKRALVSEGKING